MVVSNVCNKGTSYYNRTLGVKVRKPRVIINNDNYKYLELLDNVRYGFIKDIHRHMEDNQLSYRVLMKYANVSKNKNIINKGVWL